ncbi:MAG: zinc metallopeptidase [Lachnospiraceae bacterium]|nr:zinc metallopeptidase [Lachnospiraceae bacterium]
MYYSYGYGYGVNSSYLLVLVAMVIAMIAQWAVTKAFKQYSQVGASSGISGAEAAHRFLQMNGIYDVTIVHTSGSLTDNYNSSNKTLNLSDSVYGSTSVSAVAVAAHECGHAVQDAVGYGPLRLRTAMVPVANIGSKASWILFMLGLFLNITGLIKIGIICFMAALAFQVVTLPVEFDASRRGLMMLTQCGVLAEEEMTGARKVLRSAAFTYVAAVITSLFQLLRFLAILNGGRRRR